VQEGDHVHRAIDRAHLAADDVGHGLAVERGGRREIAWLGAVYVVRLERVALSLLGTIEVVDPSGHGAVAIERRAEAERLRLARERRLMRTAHHRARDRMIDHGEPSGRSSSLATHFDDVRSELQLRDARDERGC
jgi:hypothetical protein